MTTWENCAAAERHPDKLNGVWAFEARVCPCRTYLKISKMGRPSNSFWSGFSVSTVGRPKPFLNAPSTLPGQATFAATAHLSNPCGNIVEATEKVKI